GDVRAASRGRRGRAESRIAGQGQGPCGGRLRPARLPQLLTRSPRVSSVREFGRGFSPAPTTSFLQNDAPEVRRSPDSLPTPGPRAEMRRRHRDSRGQAAGRGYKRDHRPDPPDRGLLMVATMMSAEVARAFQIQLTADALSRLTPWQLRCVRHAVA